METQGKIAGMVPKPLLFIIVLLMISFPTSCKKKASCFDRELYYQHLHDYCPADCPGVEGCDGKTYCNACEARRVGIRVVE
ncbi:MAG TPA: hypothetical protein VD905_01400 [Flavobacteriales bacterium]|nr:hypothetical protein [Flavobacteriales bacterium]